MTEKDESLQQLKNSVLVGKADESRQAAYAALARGNTNGEILDEVVEAADIVVDLHEVGQYEQGKLIATENAITACLQVLEEWLAKSEGKFGVKVTVGPVGHKAGPLLALVISATLRSVGFHSTSLGKTQTALDLLRNSEELGAHLVIPLLPGDGVEEHLQNLANELKRGGFSNKFEVIPITPGLSENAQTPFTIARNSEEAISKATEWALRRHLQGVV